MRLVPIAALAVAFASIVVVDLFNPQYRAVVEPASRYVHGRAGWLIVVSLVVIAVTSALLARRTRRLAPSGRRACWGQALLVVWAAGVLVAAVFPADAPGRWSHPSVSDTVHGLAAWAALTAFPVGAGLLTAALGGPARLVWPALASVLSTVVLAVFLIDVMGGRSLPGIFGLVERATLGMDLAWLCAVASLPRPERIER